MYYTTSVSYNQHGGGHNHTLQVNDLPSHSHDMIGDSSMNLAFEKNDFIINIDKGNMVDIGFSHNKIIDDDTFLDNICDCVVGRFIDHNINLFKAGNSNELKEMILNFLKKET